MRYHRSGFTIVEIIVTITIMAILLTLTVARLRSSQMAGRDRERESDISAIATGLETYYKNGPTSPPGSAGNYPGATEVASAKSATVPLNNFLDGVPLSSYSAPNKTAVDSFGVDPGDGSAPASEPDGSYTDEEALDLLGDISYLYQPLKRDNTFCVDRTDCVKFNLYYKTETDDVVHKVRSVNQ